MNCNRLDFFHSYEVFKDLGLIRGVSKVDMDKERLLFVDMWRDLDGDTENGVQPAVLLEQLNAILGFYNVAYKAKNVREQENMMPEHR